tara:strand:+ start:47 stop:772 length:726 start_codon:yes stop_codon:yes gene_type:complete
MDFTQENIYKLKEADAYFKRTPLKDIPKRGEIRESKKEILSLLDTQLGEKLQNLDVLEIGCFVGDLLAKLSKDFNCNVNGIEPSSLATAYAKENFDLNLINNTFDNSIFFDVNEANKSNFDLIIADGVFNCFSRNKILTAVGVIDWLLKPNGYLFIKDFSPTFELAHPHHHLKSEEIYSYKVSGGHKNLFLASGMYLIDYEITRLDEKFDFVKSAQADSTIWSNALLKKVDKPVYPIVDFS